MKNCLICKSELVTFEGETHAVILDKIHGYAFEFEEAILSLEIEKHQRNILLDLVDRMKSDFPHNGDFPFDSLNDLKDVQY